MTDRPTCSRPECTRLVTARTVCRMHYLQARRDGTLDQLPTRSRNSPRCAPDHAHDHDTCYLQHGCRCATCKLHRHNFMQRRRARLRAYGREDQINSRVPMLPVHEHVVCLHRAGFGLERIAEAANVSTSAVFDVVYGPRGRNRQHRETDPAKRTLRPDIAGALLAVTPDVISRGVVDALGARRRLQALSAIGHSQTSLAKRLGVMVGNLNPVATGRSQRIMATTHAQIVELYTRLCMTPATGAMAEKTRRLAASRGWLPPLAWDDIDDPSEHPDANAATAEPIVDEIAIDLVINGHWRTLTRPEKKIAARRMKDHGMQITDIATRLRMSNAGVKHILQKAHDQQEERTA